MKTKKRKAPSEEEEKETRRENGRRQHPDLVRSNVTCVVDELTAYCFSLYLKGVGKSSGWGK